ncbi:hypothetical protein OAM67_00170 [bacterium]|nr:hypothetical protein [bacterium]
MLSLRMIQLSRPGSGQSLGFMCITGNTTAVEFHKNVFQKIFAQPVSPVSSTSSASLSPPAPPASPPAPPAPTKEEKHAEACEYAMVHIVDPKQRKVPFNGRSTVDSILRDCYGDNIPSKTVWRVFYRRPLPMRIAPQLQSLSKMQMFVATDNAVIAVTDTELIIWNNEHETSPLCLECRQLACGLNDSSSWWLDRLTHRLYAAPGPTYTFDVQLNNRAPRLMPTTNTFACKYMDMAKHPSKYLQISKNDRWMAFVGRGAEIHVVRRTPLSEIDLTKPHVAWDCCTRHVDDDCQLVIDTVVVPLFADVLSKSQHNRVTAMDMSQDGTALVVATTFGCHVFDLTKFFAPKPAPTVSKPTMADLMRRSQHRRLRKQLQRAKKRQAMNSKAKKRTVKLSCILQQKQLPPWMTAVKLSHSVSNAVNRVLVTGKGREIVTCSARKTVIWTKARKNATAVTRQKRKLAPPTPPAITSNSAATVTYNVQDTWDGLSPSRLQLCPTDDFLICQHWGKVTGYDFVRRCKVTLSSLLAHGSLKTTSRLERMHLLWRGDKFQPRCFNALVWDQDIQPVPATGGDAATSGAATSGATTSGATTNGATTSGATTGGGAEQVGKILHTAKAKLGVGRAVPAAAATAVPAAATATVAVTVAANAGVGELDSKSSGVYSKAVAVAVE